MWPPDMDPRERERREWQLTTVLGAVIFVLLFMIGTVWLKQTIGAPY